MASCQPGAAQCCPGNRAAALSAGRCAHGLACEDGEKSYQTHLP